MNINNNLLNMTIGSINFITIKYYYKNYLLENYYSEHIIKNIIERTKKLLNDINDSIIKITIIINYNNDLPKTIEFNKNIYDNIDHDGFVEYFRYELKIYLNKKKCNELKKYKCLIELIINNLKNLSYIKIMINYLEEEKYKLYNHEYVLTSDELQFKIIDEKKGCNNIHVCLEEVINNLYKFINFHYDIYMFIKFEYCYNKNSLYNLFSYLNMS